MTAPSFLTARWSHLLMLNHPVDPAVLRPLVPAGTELDDFQGTTFVSVVGFLFLDTRVKGVPIPFHRDFEEVNLRFYVRRDVAGERRRGVVFVREFVPRRAIAFVARRVYGERYAAVPMQHELVSADAAGGTGSLAYRWRTAAGWNSVAASFGGAAREATPGSREEFITEHYWGYAASRRGSLEYRVEHPRWRLWDAREPALACDVATVYGCLLYTSPSPRDRTRSRMPSSA